jgi:hypothetical protein
MGSARPGTHEPEESEACLDTTELFAGLFGALGLLVRWGLREHRQDERQLRGEGPSAVATPFADLRETLRPRIHRNGRPAVVVSPGLFHRMIVQCPLLAWGWAAGSACFAFQSFGDPHRDQ